MSTIDPAGDLFLVVGYDGSPPATRALDAAAGLLRGRTGRIEAVYVAHMPGLDMMSSGALAEMEVSFNEVEQELRNAVGEQLRGREDRWGYERREGPIAAEGKTLGGYHPKACSPDRCSVRTVRRCHRNRRPPAALDQRGYLRAL